MSTGQILLLGAIAGLTIFIGLPIGRMHRVSLQTKGFLSAAATGILIFLLWDVLSGAVNPVEQALKNGQTGRFSWWATILTLGFSVGLVSLVLYDGWMKRRRRKTFVSVGAAAATDLRRHWFHGMSPGRWLSLFIATGIGLHNFSEGLAIGQSAARDELALAVALIVGFGLHNATEGFGIVAPLAAEDQQPSWSFLGLMGLIAGTPTFVGTLIGQAWTSEALSILFLALAAGSILYVVIELTHVCRTLCSKTIMTWGILLGLFLGFATDFILVASGA
ncbi:MAG: zinc transporter, family [Gaiellaceae bacterium]|nr:zinc transporter, family [Gaiellaceae bacterium]